MHMNTMKALYCQGGPTELRTGFPMPMADGAECLVRVSLAGVCATDLEMMAGYRPDFHGVLGHEFVGIVEEAPNAQEWIGRRVVGEINIGCGACALCRRGLDKHCRKRRTLGIAGKDGAFAEYLTLPTANLHAVPDDVSDDQAVFTEPMAAALQVLGQTTVRPTDAVAVVGDGRLGLLVAQVLAQTGCRLTVFGRHDANLGLLAHSGAETVLVGEDAVDNEWADAFDTVVEASGAESGFITARAIVRPGGVMILKSTFAKPMASFDSSRLVVDEVSVVGSRCGPFAPALRLLSRGEIQVEPMIHARYALADGMDALAHAGRRGVLKVLVVP